jgi:hypothetical protein
MAGSTATAPSMAPTPGGAKTAGIRLQKRGGELGVLIAA